MKLHLTRPEGESLFTGYGPGYVTINGEQYRHPIIVATGRPVEAWKVDGFDTLTPSHFEALLELKPEIVLLGSGDALRFPHPRLTGSLLAAAVGFEAMDTKAACRTYNILMAEGRQVVAAILV